MRIPWRQSISVPKQSNVSQRSDTSAYWPAARNANVFFPAWSISSGVKSTVVLVLTVPVDATPMENVAALTLSGASMMATTSSSPNE